MKKIGNLVITVLASLLLYPVIANANIICNDGTVSPSCGDCHRGCCSHHGGCSGRTISTSSYKAVKKKPKSKDTSLKEVLVDYSNVNLADNMYYTTTKESVYVYVDTSDNNATVRYDNRVNLDVGSNVIYLKVTAENGNTKTYKLNIFREKLLSNNKNIKITVDNDEIDFFQFVSKTINIPYEKNKIDLKYNLEDKSATVEIIGNDHLVVGENEIIVRVKAEDGTKQDYTIVVNKLEKEEEKNNDAFYTIIGVCSLCVFVEIICFIYLFLKKHNLKK